MGGVDDLECHPDQPAEPPISPSPNPYADCPLLADTGNWTATGDNRTEPTVDRRALHRGEAATPMAAGPATSSGQLVQIRRWCTMLAE